MLTPDQVLKVIEKHTDVSFNFQEHLFGGVSGTR
jgi:3-isopropylmalate dehydrogenase